MDFQFTYAQVTYTQVTGRESDTYTQHGQHTTCMDEEIGMKTQVTISSCFPANCTTLKTVLTV